jgi:hypothetical protein
MIHYALQCPNGHQFDGWFHHSAGFDAQVAAGFVSCPSCGELHVRRALMAPALVMTRARLPATGTASPGLEQAPAPTPAPTPSPPLMPDEMRAALQRLRREVEARSENVGDGFAREARRIHKGETPTRSIYGEATPVEREALAEDGISVMTLPWIDRADS